MNRTLKTILSAISALALVAVTAAPAGAAKPSEKSRGQSETKKYSGSSQRSQAAPRSSQGSTQRSAPSVRSQGSSRPSQGSVQRSAPTVRSQGGSRPDHGSVQRSAPTVRSQGGSRSDQGRGIGSTQRSAPSVRSQGGSRPDNGRATAPAPRIDTRVRPTPQGRSDSRGSIERGRPTERREVERQQPSRGPRFEAPQREERGGRSPQADIRGRGDERRGGSSQQGWSDRSGRQDVRDLGRPGSRSEARGGSEVRSTTRGKDGRLYDTSRAHDREGARRWESTERYDRKYAGKPTQKFEGTVQRYERGSGGYNVWLSGGHCFFIPDYRWHLWPLRIGIFVTFGGYWNPLGFYNVYDYGWGPYYGGFYGGYGGGYGGYYGGGYGGGYPRPYYQSPYPGSYGGGYQTTYVQGYVDRFDEYDGGFVVRDDRTGRYISVYMRYDDPQYRNLRVGDWVTLSGAWARDGYFEAYRIQDVR